VNVSTRAASPDEVRAALEELLGWPELSRSPQLSNFLRYIVETKLRGDEAAIKAYSVAVDVFGRPPSFDPQTDPIVRVQARRLRGLLQEFYREKLGRTGVRITLPVGRYVPEFERVAADTTESLSTEQAEPASPPPVLPRVGRRFWTQVVAAAALVVVLVAVLVGVRVLRDTPPAGPAADLPQEPTVYLSSFTNVTRLPGLDTFASRLTDQLSSTLAQFEDLQVRFVDPTRPLARAADSFILSGTVATDVSGIEVAAVLTDAITGSAVWNQNQTRAMPASDDQAAIEAVTWQMMRELGAFRGPVHTRGRRWLETNLQLPAVNGYLCLLSYRFAREFLDPAAIAKATDCHERLLEAEPNLPLALAAEAWFEGRAIYANVEPDERMDESFAQPLDLAERARELAPESPFAHEQLASIQTWMERYDVAQRNYAIALGFEPLNTDARAGYAMSLARTGDWSGAAQQAERAIADAPHPSPWYYFLPSLIALRDGDYVQAVAKGRIAAQGGEFGALVTLAAGGLAGDRSAVSDFSAPVMSMQSLKRIGILPWLRLRINDEALLGRLAEGLRAGGIPESALTARF